MHNHWWEFEPLEGKLPIRLLHERLPPEISWQLDVYSAQTAGADPTGVLSEPGSRVESIHLVDIPGILRGLSHPVDRVIELDECASDPLEAAQQSLLYLESRKNRRWHARHRG